MTQALSSTTSYLLPPSLQDLHVKTLSWESSLELWKRELVFFRKLIDHHGKEIHRRHEVEEREHFTMLLNYYSEDLFTSFENRLHAHEAALKDLMTNTPTQDEGAYRLEHRILEHQVNTFEKEFICFKNELYLLMEKVLLKNKSKNELK